MVTFTPIVISQMKLMSMSFVIVPPSNVSEQEEGQHHVILLPQKGGYFPVPMKPMSVDPIPHLKWSRNIESALRRKLGRSLLAAPVVILRQFFSPPRPGYTVFDLKNKQRCKQCAEEDGAQEVRMWFQTLDTSPWKKGMAGVSEPAMGPMHWSLGQSLRTRYVVVPAVCLIMDE